MRKGYFVFSIFMMLLLMTGLSAKTLQPSDKAVADDSAAVKNEPAIPESSVVDEVVWVVGDEPILKSDIEVSRLQAESEGVKWNGNPDCAIPEQLAVQKLFLHQAAIDSIEVSESDILTGVEQQLNYMINMAGSREKLEEYRNQSLAQMREQLRDDFKNRQLVEKMKEKLVEDISVTPAEVRNYFKDVPEDSVPYVPTEVEVEIITRQPKISQEEINRVKDELRGFTDRINKGETTFATLARLYSEDGSARQGGEIGYAGRGTLDPAFANVAFNLTDTKKVSKIVESEFGFHIIQLIDKRGDKVNVRHILLKPKVSPEAMTKAREQLDSLATDIKAGKVTFEDAATYVSDDKDTRNNHGLMSTLTEDRLITSRFQMKNLPTEVARQIENMKKGDVSPAFEMINSKGKTVCAIVKLKDRIEGHHATITEDYQVMKKVVERQQQNKLIHDWVVNKIKHTYVWMNPRYKDCQFEYQGWVK